jgi:hypothetical protein
MAGFTEIPRTIRIIEARPERRYEGPPRKAGTRQARWGRVLALLVIAATLIALYFALGTGRRRAAEAASAPTVIESFESGRALRASVMTPRMEREVEREARTSAN